MAVKYTTATHVRNMLAGRVASTQTDAMIEANIERAEGMIDTWLKVGAGTASNSLTFSASKKPHLVLELAATMMAASLLLAQSSLSWVSMEQALLMAETMIYWAEKAEAMIKDEDDGNYIVEQ